MAGAEVCAVVRGVMGVRGVERVDPLRLDWQWRDRWEWVPKRYRVVK
jgi:hypothetical protein